jgi:hypothetical protein
MSIEDELRKAIESVCADPLNYATEDAFQAALADALGNTQREVLMTFEPPPIAPQNPSAADIAELAKEGCVLPTTGKDPCDGRSRRLDILWNDIPIELKSVVTVKADLNGYDFLKDIHRLERVSGVANGTVLSDTRFAVFVSAHAKLWQHEYPKAPNIHEGQRIEPGHWVQYKQPSVQTRWSQYPPFYLAGRYELNWSPLPNGAKYLLVPVKKQNAPSI